MCVLNKQEENASVFKSENGMSEDSELIGDPDRRQRGDYKTQCTEGKC